MEIAAVVLAGLALFVALVARATAKGLAQRVDDGAAEARRRVEGVHESVEQALALQRRMLARVAAGEELSREQILEGRLWSDLDPKEGEALLAAGNVRALDVRTPQETAGGILPGALRIPVDQLESRVRELPRDGKPTIVYCAAGGRSAAACEFLSQAGYDGLMNLTGGFSSWQGPRERPST